MDYFAKNERKIIGLRQEMIEDIRTIFYSRGYKDGETTNGITVEYDRVLVNMNDQLYHVDNLTVEQLLSWVRRAEHIIYKSDSDTYVS